MVSFKWSHGVARLLGLLFLMLASGVGRAEFDYQVDETNNSAIITGNDFFPGMDFWAESDVAEIIIPSKLNGMPVTGIGPYALRRVRNLTSVMIPKSVIKIEPGAFSGCPDLETITVDPLNPSYTSVDGVLFDKNVSTLIQYPGGKVGAYAIPGSVTKLDVSWPTTAKAFPGAWIPFISWGYGPFLGCVGLTSVTIPNGITSLGSATFEGCTGLTRVTFPEGVTRIDGGTFAGCISLNDVTIPDSVTNIASLELEDPGPGLRQSAAYPNQLGAFQGCTNLTHVTIPRNVTSIAPTTFYNCTSLKSIEVEAGNPVYKSVDGVLFNRDQSVLIMCSPGKAERYAIPNGVISISDYAFLGCVGLTSLDIPGSVASIGNGTFGDCIGLTSLTIPNGVTNLSDQAFSGCWSLTNVVIPGRVTRIGNGTFEDCASLTSIIIPSGVTRIGDRAFSGCANLGGIAIPESVNAIGADGFRDCMSLTNVVIPKGVTSIADGTFQRCWSLTSITIPNSVTSIENYAFGGCPNLTRIYFRGKAPLIGFLVFDEVKKAVVFKLPGTTGWGATFGGLRTALWLPRVEAQDGTLGVQANQFGFNISWSSGQVVVVEASTELVNPVWSPQQTIPLTSDSVRFTDPEGSKEPTRFYRVRPQ